MPSTKHSSSRRLPVRARPPSSCAADATVRERLDRALETLEEAHVNTIHGFCADLLRERPVEAAIDPLFTVLTEAQSERLYARAFRGWLEEALQDPPEGLRRALRRTSGGFTGDGNDGPIDRLRAAGRQLVDWRGFDTPWRRPLFDRAGEVDRLIGALQRFAALTEDPASPRDNLHTDTAAARRTSRQIQLEQSLDQRDLDGWEARLVDLARDRAFSRPRKGYGSKYSRSVARADLLAERDTLWADLQQFRKDADADLAACLQLELAGAAARYEALKRASGSLDFVDLLARTRDLVAGDDAVRRHLQGKFTRLFVDEFQDTDPLQAEILLLLAADDPSVGEWTRVRPVPGKLFIVGDPKQAIYRFRGADVGTYWQVSRHLEQHGGRRLQLSTSYRGVPGIQAFVNAAFRHEMTADPATLQAGYVPLHEYRPQHTEQPAVVALPVPRPYSSRGSLRASPRAIERSLPDAVGAFIAWLVDEGNGWQVVERGADGADALVPLAARHIAVLFRRFVSWDTDVTRPYIEAIEARNVPHLLVGGKAFHNREEVETIRAALAAIEWPDDELSVFATLKGSLFAIDDAHLLEFRHRFGPCHPFRIPRELGGNSGAELALTDAPAAHLLPIAQALGLLQRLHRGRNHRPVADTVGRLLEETRAHVGLILRPAGEQALANVLHVAELARQYEMGGGISFRGFIDELRQAASTEAAEAPVLEEGSDGVRLMTVHKAKGLEFPVVILADLTCRMHRNDATRYVDAERRLAALRIGGWSPHDLHDHEALEVARDRAEGVRLAYVAATRARDLLVVPALGDGPWEGGWLSCLNRALYPAPASRRSAGRGPRCPAFPSKDSVVERPDDEIALPATVCPGEHQLQPDGPTDPSYPVVWWDPHALELGVKAPFGVRRDDLIVKDVARHVVADGRSRYDRWRLAREEARTAGSVPSLRVEPARQWAADAREEAALDRIETSIVDAWNRQDPRPGAGPALGALVHAVLAHVSFDAPGSEIEAIAAVEARVLGLGQTDVRAASARVEHVLRHDLLQRARTAMAEGRCRRETAVASVMTDGALVEGIADLAFEEDGRWIVVDYKTDAELAADGEARYRRQVGLYAAAIARATGCEASGVILRV